jgi:cytoskeletal protein CcmA (bactofilin family)
MTIRASAVIGEDLVIQGELRCGGDVEVLGYITGSVSAARIMVHPSGKVHGTVRAQSAEVNGFMQGTIAVQQLISIGETGSVSGDVRYGQLALARGGELSADVRNVPPALGGDLNLAVRRGRSVRITTDDIRAIDPDSGAAALIFAVSSPNGGSIVHFDQPQSPLESFSQEELQGGSIYFQHDGGSASEATIDVVVTDQAGATSGAPRTLHVAVINP